MLKRKQTARNGNSTLISAAVILGVSSLVSRIIGLLRDRVFSTQFGAGDTLDAFVAAFRIPDLVFNVVVIGALSAAFIPLFTEKLVKNKKNPQVAMDFALSILNIIVVIVAALSIVYIVFADSIVPLITPGFSAEKLQLTIMLSKIMAIQPILLSISSVFSGVLNSYKRFFAYALAPILYNLGIIFGALVLVPMMGMIGLAWGVVLGAALHLLVQLPSVLKCGFRWKPLWISSLEDVKSLWNMILPRVFGQAASQINLLVVTILGSGLLAGSISVFNFANNLQYVPIGIFGLAFAQAAFPTLAEHLAEGSKRKFLNTLTKTFRYILFFVIPVSVFFFLLRAQIVRVLLGDGAFDWEDTFLTFQTFGFLIISIFAQATIPLLTRAFYVQQDTKTPVYISLVSIALNAGLAWYLAPIYGVQGLAIAFSASAILNMTLLLGVLHWQLKGFNDKEVLFSLSRISFSAIVAGGVLQASKYAVAAVVDMQTFLGVAAQLVVCFILGVLSYIALCWILKSDELNALKKYIPRKPRLQPGMETSRFSGMPE